MARGSWSTDDLWYAMLFPRVRGVRPVTRRMDALTGGTPNPDQHVTIGILLVTDPGTDLAAPLRHLAGPVVPIRASEPYNYNARYRLDAPTTHATLVRVVSTAALRGWYGALHATVVRLDGRTSPSPRGAGDDAAPACGDHAARLAASLAQPASGE